jgi:hypothetical protein
MNNATNAAAKNEVIRVLGQNALIQLNGCNMACNQEGRDHMQALANLFNARVRGKNGYSTGYPADDDPNWIIVNPAAP